jgi:hypothetical protein
MKVFRLWPVLTDDPLWKYSVEKTHLWAGALTPGDARDLVAVKSGFYKLADAGAASPWKDARVTGCAEEPTMDYPSAGEVIREDGSTVNH